MSLLLNRLCLSSVLLLSAGVASAQRFDFLGDAHVDGGVDHDNIVVTAARGEFRAIQLRVSDNTVDFQRVVVHFGDGSAEPLLIRAKIKPGGTTRIIDLPGRRRVIQSVELWYSRANWGPRRPRVSLYGVR